MGYSEDKFKKHSVGLMGKLRAIHRNFQKGSTCVFGDQRVAMSPEQGLLANFTDGGGETTFFRQGGWGQIAEVVMWKLRPNCSERAHCVFSGEGSPCKISRRERTFTQGTQGNPIFL